MAKTGRFVIATASRLISARLLYQLLYAVAIIQVSNYLISEPELLDTFDVATSIVSILMMVSSMGLGMVVMRHGAQKEVSQFGRYFGTALGIETVVSVMLYAVALTVYGSAYGFTPLFWLLAILGLSQAALQYRVVLRAVYRSLYASEKITYIEIIDGALKLAGVWWIVHNIESIEYGVYAIASWFSLTTIVFIGIYGLNTLRYVKPSFKSSLVSPMMREGSWFAVQAIVMTVYFEIDKLMLQLFQSTGWYEIPDGDIGRYSAAARLIVFLLLFHRIGSQVISPYLYANFEKNMDRFRKIVRLSTKYQGTLGIGMGVGLWLLGPDIIALIYREELAAAGQALRWFGLFIIVRFVGVTSTQVFATTKQQPTRTKFIVAGVLFNIALDAVLIPMYGFMGGVYATVVTETGFQVLFYIMSRRSIHTKVGQELLQLLPAVGAAIAMTALIWLLQGALPTVALVALGAMAYGCGLVVLGFIRQEDIRLLKAA